MYAGPPDSRPPPTRHFVNCYRPAWWLPGPHAQTLWGKFGRHEALHSARWERLATPDGDFVELAHNDLADGAPRLLLLHGLEGGVNSHYVRGFMREARSLGWNTTLMLFRTCGPTLNTLPRSYHSGETGDLRFVLETLSAREPSAPIGAAAVSLGGNVLCKLLGEGGAPFPHQLKGAVAISTPFSLARASRYIGEGFARVYELSFLRSLVPKALAKIARHPELRLLTPVKNARTIWEFDDLFTSPLHGFANAADYYAQSSSLQFLHGIRIPTLLLSAMDDPFLPPAVLDEVREIAEHNAAITIEFPARGGHVGFVAGGNPYRPFYYGEWRGVQFLGDCFSRERAAVSHGKGLSL
jgi:predicted alpha/beta-fold hydrolase